jgi:hypothetical protein
MGTPTRGTTKYYYDDAVGSPVNITAKVLTKNDIDLKNILQQVMPFGVTMPVHSPTGQGELAVIEFGGVCKIGDDSIDDLFADRIPEDPDVATRTFIVEYEPERQTSVETHLLSYKRTPASESGTWRYSVQLQPTGDVTESFAT